MSHRRYNPLLDEWVLSSPGRLKRPWLGQSDERAARTLPAYEPECYMCPGNLRASGARNPQYDGVFLFDNDYPALTPDAAPVESSPLLVAEPAAGRCRVVSFSPRHDLHFGAMTSSEARQVIDVWAEESERLATDDGAAYVQVFENRGSMMGASNPHPHGQIWATAHVPSIPSKKAHQQQAYWERRGADLLGDYVEEELRRQERIVECDEHWVQLAPFWAVWPFETMLVPRRHVGELNDLHDDERASLSRLVPRLTRRYDALFETPFPYSMGWYQRPRDRSSHPGSRLHAVYFPPLVRSATVRKFIVGYEMTSEPQRDFTAEEAAQRLRACVVD